MIEILEIADACGIKMVEDMAEKIWTEHYTPIIGKPQVDYMLSRFQSARAIREQINEGYRYFIAVGDGRELGYFCIMPRETENSMFISKVYVDSEFRGLGIARAMIGHVEEICRRWDLDTMYLTVNKNNTRSIAAYEKMGFYNAGSIVQDIGGGFVMDDYKMVKSL